VFSMVMQLIVGWWRDRTPSGSDGLPLDVMPLTARFLRDIVGVEETFLRKVFGPLGKKSLVLGLRS